MSNRDVWGFKLMNGFELIGEVPENDQKENYYIIKNALGLALMPNEEDPKNPYLKFVPFSAYMDVTNVKHMGLDLELAKSNVLAKYRINPHIAKEYCEATGSIVIATSI